MLKCVSHSGGQCASFGLVIRQEKGQQGYSLHFCHAHNLCGKPPRGAPGDMGKLLLSLQPLSKCCFCPLQQRNPTLVLRLSTILHLDTNLHPVSPDTQVWRPLGSDGTSQDLDIQALTCFHWCVLDIPIRPGNCPPRPQDGMLHCADAGCGWMWLQSFTWRVRLHSHALL